ncbi:hypothetical protein [Sphingobacterium puteale]|uniref:hypothetical protein n=1 Tax=Sphingobacterium puteale TaxID=2420510 RepID=UPI001C7CBF79|nr:hypothetical protein [Sphingobacterium puteale]
MKLLDFFKIFKRKTTARRKLEADGYLPLLWEDDYCQVVIVPLENMAYVLKSIAEIEPLSEVSRTDFGFTEIFEHGEMPITTISKEIREDYLMELLTVFGFERATHIDYNYDKIIDCTTRQTKAFGFSNFTIFFEIEGEFVKHVWLSISERVSLAETSVKKFEHIKSVLYRLGEECEMILVDWNSMELIDLRNRYQINNYLNYFWK